MNVPGSSKQSLTRSRSSSSIPVIRKSGIPRLSVKNTAQKSIPKPSSRASRASSLDKTISRSSSSCNLLGIPQFNRQRSGSVVSKRSTTPRISTYRRSPGSSAKKDSRPISDRSWQYGQTVKVQSFVASAFPFLDHKIIKSGIPVEAFVGLVDGLFKFIDRRLIVTRENHIEEVPKLLKTYGYPVNIKSSLMKTVNTPHSWSHVLAILSWLVDLITELNTPLSSDQPFASIPGKSDFELNTIGFDFYWSCYKKWNESEEEEEDFSEITPRLTEIYHLDTEQIQVLDAEIKNLHSETAVLQAKFDEYSKEMETLKANTNNLNTKREQFEAEQIKYQNALQKQKTEYSQKMKAIDEQINVFLKQQEEIVSKKTLQPHSKSQYKQLIQDVEDLQPVVNYKEQKQEERSDFVIKYDHEIMDLKEQMRKHAFQYNSIIYKQGLLSPNLRELGIREEGFAKRDTDPELLHVKESLMRYLNEIKERDCMLSKKEEELQPVVDETNDKFSAADKKKDELLTAEAELKLILAHDQNKFKIEKQKLTRKFEEKQNKLSQLTATRESLEPLQKEKQEWEERVATLLSNKQKMQKDALTFFCGLESRIHDNMRFYMNTMEKTMEEMVTKQETAIKAAENTKKKIQKTREEIKLLKSKK